MTEGKACLKSQVLSLLLKTPREGARQMSGGRLFKRRGAIAEKAQFLVLSFQASLSVRPLSHPSWLEQVVDLGGRRHSARY